MSKSSVTIIDGAMGTELIRRGAAVRGGLWSAQALIDAPEAVVEVHRDYIRAGAEIIITNSYSTIPSYLSKSGLEDRFVSLTEYAGQLARRAALEFGGPQLQVAGSLPPLSESYRWDLVPDDSYSEDIYRKMAQALLPSVDLLLCETMSSVREAKNALSAARSVLIEKQSQTPLYVSFTLNERPGAGIRSGESLHDAVQAVTDIGVDAFLVNCTSPEAVLHAVQELRDLTDLPIGGYPNRLSVVPDGWKLDAADKIPDRTDLTPARFAELGERCVAMGATMIGGCCGIAPEHIEALEVRLRHSAVSA